MAKLSGRVYLSKSETGFSMFDEESLYSQSDKYFINLSLSLPLPFLYFPKFWFYMRCYRYTERMIKLQIIQY